VRERRREGSIYNFTTASPLMLTILVKTIVNTDNNKVLPIITPVLW